MTCEEYNQQPVDDQPAAAGMPVYPDDYQVDAFVERELLAAHVQQWLQNPQPQPFFMHSAIANDLNVFRQN
jgi:hypothetical protein